ncbi:MAG: type IV pilus secretin family protein [Desulfuromonadales bacterium]|nr:MAG: type IV pilus secretin family protein [Desulfuromonadales bacterium]
MKIQVKIARAFALTSVMGALFGCAGADTAVRSDAAIAQVQGGVLKDIKVVGDGAGSQVLLSADRPLAYTFYKTSNPPKAVVDLAQIGTIGVNTPVEVNKGYIKRIDAARYGEGETAMTRVEVLLARDVEMVAATDEKDKGQLKLSFVPSALPAPVEPPPSVAPAPAPAVENVAEPAVVKDSAPPVEAKPAVPVEGEATASSSAPKATTREASRSQAALTAIVSRGDALEILTTGEVDDFKSFRLAKPDRLVVDLMGAKSAMTAKVVPLSNLGVGTVRIGSYPEKVRLVFDASGESLPAVTVEKFSTGLRVIAAPKGSESARAATPSPAPARMPEQEKAPAAKAAAAVPPAEAKTQPQSKHKSGPPAVESIDFAMADDIARLTVVTSGPCEADKPVKADDGVTLTLKNCLLPRNLQRFLDTSSFGSVVQRVTPYQVKTRGRNDVKIQVKLRRQASYDLKKDGDRILFEVKNPAGYEAPKVGEELAMPVGVPAVAKQPAATSVSVTTPSGESKKVYTGRRVTLEFSDADIRKIFQLIAEVSNLNFLVGDDVSGTISLKLVNVPWDQALDVILENKGLGMQRDGNIVQIRPKSKIQTLADEEQSLKRAKERAMELKTEVFDVNFATVAGVATQFNALKSERGTITQDSRTNRVIVKDIAPAIDDMKGLLRNLDSPEKQVMIEARIVEVETNISSALGIQWGLHATDTDVMGITNVDAGFGGILTGVASSTGTFGPGLATGITFGKLISNGTLDLKLSALATRGNAKIISTPKVVTLNNKAAKISQGQSIPYSTVSAEGTKTEFVEAALTLEVTPHITADGSVVMKIKASNNSAGTPIGSGAPPINKKEATTELLVKNSETTVIGGIYIDTDRDSDQGVPFLKDIPFLGHLFKSSIKQKQKTELLIFITPKILAS